MALYIRWVALALMAFVWMAACHADGTAPWGRATLKAIDYRPQKVVYDVAVDSVAAFSRVLDRVSYLNKLYAADPFEESIVLVLHGNEIPFFAVSNSDRYHDLMERARSLMLSGPIKFSMCRIAARSHGLEPGDINGFVEVVPMADAEIVRLQQEQGYAYMR